MSYTASYIVNSSSAQGTTDFTFTFPYIKEEHIEVYLNYTKITQGSGSAQYQVITNVSPKLIRLNTGITSANLRVEIRRNSSLDTPLVDYADGSTLTANDLDTSALQSLYIDQELKDNQGKTVSVDPATALPTLNNLRLTNVANPTAAQDAATKNYIDTFTGNIDGRDLSVDGAKLDGIEANATADQTNAEIRAAVEAASDSNVFTDADHSKLNAIEASATADQTDAEIRTAVENATDSNVFTDADHTKLNAIEASATADQTDAEIRAAVEAATDSNVFTDADHTKLNGIEASATADQTAAEIKTAYESNAQTNPLTDAEKAVIDGVTSNTSELNKLDGYTGSTNDLNIVSGKSFKTSSGTLDTTSDTEIPSSKVIAAHVASSQTAIGGFVTIADEVSFPNTQPATGVVVSINNAAGVVINGSGVSTTGRRLDTTVVTINGFPSSLYSETLAAGVGLLVTATSTANTYNYHKILVAESDVKQLSDDINDFNSRYRIASSAPSSNNDEGDLYFDTGANKMKVYNGSAWDDVASVGSFFVNTISSSSGTGGGSATFNGSAYRFTLSNAGTAAQQHIVSVNGVIQKPNSGTSQPSEGFAIDGSDIIFSAAPASGADYFIITQGSSVSIGTPSANSVNSSHIIDGSITNADISSSAAIAGSKLADDSITEVKLDIHNAPSGTDKFLKYTANGMEWAVDNNTVYTHPNHTGEVTSTADGATVIASDVVDEDNLKVSNSPTNGYFLQAQSGNTGGMTWAEVAAGGATFDATTNGAVSEGDPLLVESDGKVRKVNQLSDAVSSVLDFDTVSSIYAPYQSAYHPNSGFGYIMYRTGSSHYYTPITANGTTFTKGTKSSGQPDTGFWHVAKGGNDDGIIGITYNSSNTSYLKRYTVNNSTGALTQTSSVTVSGSGDAEYSSTNSVYCPNANRWVSFYADDQNNELSRNQKWRIINGTSVGSEKELMDGDSSSGPYFRNPMTFFDSTTGRITIIGDSPPGNIARYRTGIVGSDTVTWHEISGQSTSSSSPGKVSIADTPTIWGNSNQDSYDVIWIQEYDMFICARVNSNKMYFYKGTFNSDGTIQWGFIEYLNNSSSEATSGDVSLAYAAGKLLIVYRGDGNVTKYATVSVSSSGTFSSWSINSFSNYEPGGIEVIGFDKGRAIGLYRDESDDHIKAICKQFVSSDLVDKFVGIADANYADGATATVLCAGNVSDKHSSLSPGSKYYVSTTGTLSTSKANPEVFAGTAVSATTITVKN